MIILKFSNAQDLIKRRECLTYVFNNLSPDWETVVGVVGNFPIDNKREACRITEKYIDMGETECQCIISARAHGSSKEDVKGNKAGIESVYKNTSCDLNGIFFTPSLGGNGREKQPKPKNEESLGPGRTSMRYF